MYKTDKLKVIKTLEELDLKTLIKSSVSYDEPKKKIFIEVLKELLQHESFYDDDGQCHECGHHERTDGDIICNYLHDTIEQIKSNAYSKEIFKETKHKVEIV